MQPRSRRLSPFLGVRQILSDKSGLRVDAERNRQQILVAAEQLFLERGAGVPLDEVGKRAKVGIGTLYRRFPTREDLLAATSNERCLSLAAASRARDADHDSGAAIRAYLEELALNTSTYQSLAASPGTVIDAVHQAAMRSPPKAIDCFSVRKKPGRSARMSLFLTLSMWSAQVPSRWKRTAHRKRAFFIWLIFSFPASPYADRCRPASGWIIGDLA